MDPKSRWLLLPEMCHEAVARFPFQKASALPQGLRPPGSMGWLVYLVLRAMAVREGGLMVYDIAGLSTTDRLILEDTITACVLCSEDCLRIALKILDPLPFRSLEADDLHKVFYWAVAQHAKGTFDGVENPYRLAELWPERYLWFMDMWTPQMYDLPGFQSLCESVRDETQIRDRLLEVRRETAASAHVRYALNHYEDMVRSGFPLLTEGHKAKRGILDKFKR